MQVLWLRFLTEIDERTTKADKALLDDPHVNEALEIVEESALNAAERAEYDGFWDQVRRNTALLDDVREAHAKLDAANARADAAEARADAAEAHADAAEARADAAVEKLHQAARNLKALKLTNEQIAAATGLAVNEIEKL
jgi:hypothetical protein